VRTSESYPISSDKELEVKTMRITGFVTGKDEIVDVYNQDEK